MQTNWLVKGTTLKNYLQACKDAVSNITTFKSDPRLHPIFEHCPKSIADNYFDTTEIYLFLPNPCNINYLNIKIIIVTNIFHYLTTRPYKNTILILRSSYYYY